MTVAAPEIHCVDYWPHGIPKEKLHGYKAMIAAGQIRKRTVIVEKKTGAVLVDYLSTVPQEWIREEMGRLAREGTQEALTFTETDEEARM